MILCGGGIWWFYIEVCPHEPTETTLGDKIPAYQTQFSKITSFGIEFYSNLYQLNTKMNIMSVKRKMDDDGGAEKRKGRKKGFVWSHVLTDEEGKVTCMHCGDLIKVNFGEKVTFYYV